MRHCYSASVGEWSVAISLSVCLSACICVRAYLWNCWTNLREIFCADPLWLWLSPPLAALWHVMYFRFYGCLASSIAIPGRSVMSMNALFVTVCCWIFLSAHCFVCQSSSCTLFICSMPTVLSFSTKIGWLTFCPLHLQRNCVTYILRWCKRLGSKFLLDDWTNTLPFLRIYLAYSYNSHVHIPGINLQCEYKTGTIHTVVYPAPTVAAEPAIGCH